MVELMKAQPIMFLRQAVVVNLQVLMEPVSMAVPGQTTQVMAVVEAAAGVVAMVVWVKPI